MAVIYAEDNFSKIESKQDYCQPYGQGIDGYGRKIAMPYLVRLDGKGPWRRVYCTCFSNVGSVWLLVQGVKYHFRHDEDLKIKGVWPK
jgi:hypothetical protein